LQKPLILVQRPVWVACWLWALYKRQKAKQPFNLLLCKTKVRTAMEPLFFPYDEQTGDGG
jgi:hypothetical protein